MSDFKLDPKFEELWDITVGEPKQFIISQGEHYCIRVGCEGCPHIEDCQNEEESIQTTLVPNARTGVGFELEDFLILKFKEGHSFETLPKELWNTPHDDWLLDERNKHFILIDFKKPFKTLKGQIRYTGTVEEFNVSEYFEYFDIFNKYTPQHKIVAMDFQTQEPKYSTMTTREPLWIDIFNGSPKIIAKEIELEATTEEQQVIETKKDHIETIGDVTYCFLEGELDKGDFKEQCHALDSVGEFIKGKKPCPYVELCKTKRDFYKNVPKDWHSLNAEGFYGFEFLDADKDMRKTIRGIAKICGLALTYGGSAYTLSANMQCSEEEAQRRINNFFEKLNAVNFYIMVTKRKVLETGQVYNLFNRRRNMMRWSHEVPNDPRTFKQIKRDIGYAQRTALNHPIQSSAAEHIKISMVRVDKFITENKLNPLCGLGIARWINLSEVSYSDFKLTSLMSVHDEIDFLWKDSEMENLLPQVYKILKAHDVVKSLGFDFEFGMDVEFAEDRSFVSSSAYMGSKIHVLSLLESQKNSEERIGSNEVNCVMYSFETLQAYPETLDKINSYNPDNDNNESNLTIASYTSERWYYSDKKYSLAFIQQLGLDFELGFYDKG